MKLAIAALALCAACSGSSDGGIVSASETADKIGCSDVELVPSGEQEFFVAEQANCSVDGSDVTIRRFSNNESRDNWIKAARDFGLGRYVTFDRGVITSDDQRVADKVADKVGGKVST